MILLPLVIFNALAGLIGGAWLLLRGEWGILVAAILAVVLAPYAMALAMIPGMLLTVPGVKLLERGKTLPGGVLGMLGALYVNAIQLIWIWFCFNVPYVNHNQALHWPLCLVAYAVAVTPAQFMAKEEGPESSGTWITVMGVTIGFGLGSALGQQTPKVEPELLATVDAGENCPGHALRMRRITFEPGASIPMHSHKDRPEVYLVTEGTLTRMRSRVNSRRS